MYKHADRSASTSSRHQGKENRVREHEWANTYASNSDSCTPSALTSARSLQGPTAPLRYTQVHEQSHSCYNLSSWTGQDSLPSSSCTVEKSEPTRKLPSAPKAQTNGQPDSLFKVPTLRPKVGVLKDTLHQRNTSPGPHYSRMQHWQILLQEHWRPLPPFPGTQCEAGVGAF